MTRVLSLLMLIPLLSTQAWAIRGGPYDSVLSRSLTAIAGTYGVAMRGMRKDFKNVSTHDNWTTTTTPKTSDPSDPLSEIVYYERDPGSDDIVSTTAVLYLTVPATGICSGKVMLFHRGLMYFGTTTGLVERRSMKITLLSELSHFTIMSGATFGSRETFVSTPAVASNPNFANNQNQLNNGGTLLATGSGGTISFLPPDRTQTNSGLAPDTVAGLGVLGAPKALLDLMLAGEINLDLSVDYFTGLINVDGFANYVEVGSDDHTTNISNYGSHPRDPRQGIRRSVFRDVVTMKTEEPEIDPITGQRAATTRTTVSMLDESRVIQPENTSLFVLNGVKLKATGSRQSTDVTPQRPFVTPTAGTAWQIGETIPPVIQGVGGTN